MHLFGQGALFGSEHDPEEPEQEERHEQGRFQQRLTASVGCARQHTLDVSTGPANGVVGIAFHQPKRALISSVVTGAAKTP